MSAPGLLEAIVQRKRAEAEALHCGRVAMWSKAEAMPAAANIEALRGGSIIAEFKRRSPSGGTLGAELDPSVVAAGYVQAGVAAISVLTDGPDFGGSLGDLVAVRRVVDIPLLRKDFVVDPLQIAEARIAGADWVLLIAAILDDQALVACLEAVQRAHCHAIVEVHTVTEAERAVQLDAPVIGINNRNLATLQTDLGQFARLRAIIPGSTLCVAESGVRSTADVARLVSEGADAVLVGEVLIRSADRDALCAELVAAAQ